MTYDLDDAAYQEREAARDAEADFRDESENWTDDQWDAYEAEMRAEYDAALGPLPANPGQVDWLREDALDERDAWDATIPLAEFDAEPW